MLTMRGGEWLPVGLLIAGQRRESGLRCMRNTLSHVDPRTAALPLWCRAIQRQSPSPLFTCVSQLLAPRRPLSSPPRCAMSSWPAPWMSQVCETLDTAAGITASVMWHQAPAAAAAASAAGDSEDLLEALEHRHAKDAGAAAKAGREEAADFARLYEHHLLAGRAAAAMVAVGGGDRGVPEAERAGDGAAARHEASAAAAELEAWQALTPAEQLAALIERLRGHYCYCLYCGCHYESGSDMQQHCPGPLEADHE